MRLFKSLLLTKLQQYYEKFEKKKIRFQKLFGLIVQHKTLATMDRCPVINITEVRNRSGTYLPRNISS